MELILSRLSEILLFVLAFGLLIFLHEFGHYITAKLFHIEVEEFGFGFPPRLVKLFQFRETEFTLNWIPFGAFVRPKGENDPAVAGGLAAANPWPRLMVLLGGSLMNLITGVLLFALLFTQTGIPDYKRVLVVDISAGSPAETDGIQKDDIIVSINNEPVDSTEKLRAIVQENLGKEITLTLLRGSEEIEVRTVPRANPPKEQGALGIVMSNPVNTSPSFFTAIPAGVQKAYEQIDAVISLPGMMIRGEVSPEEGRFVGPVGIYGIFSSVRELDAQEATQTAASSEPLLGLYTLNFLATISIALGFTNLLPIPALDGGRILFVLPEILFRRRVPARYENMINLIGFTTLILLMIYITSQDIINPIVIP